MRWLVAVGVTIVLALPLAVQAFTGRHAPQQPPFFGIDVPQADAAHVTRLGDQLGCAPTVMNRFVKLDSTFGARQLAEVAADGRTPMISLEPWSWRMGQGDATAPAYTLESLARGDHDAALTSIARTLATHRGTVLLRFAHEMNADWYPWGVTVNGGSNNAYIRAWHHVHDLMSAIDPRLRWVWAPVATWWSDALPLRSVYPGDAYVDYVAATGYGHTGTSRDTAQGTFEAWYREVRSFTNRPALLAETGADGADKTAWMATLGSFLHQHEDIRGFVWFDTSPATTGATGDYRIDDRPEHLAAMRALLHTVGARCT